MGCFQFANCCFEFIFSLTKVLIVLPFGFQQYIEDHMKKLYVPRVEDKDSHMRMLNISSMDDLIANSMKILEPAPVDNDGNEREDGNISLSIL